ncbi:MAG: hypothetical protein CM15mP4_2620 [Candidatus Neomarinimicrobiota bacterium]|nr:MAG: hypothetical protein CM15mP4_2620 [Candidatus Neomarinimicrobiota bacterium]
MVLQKEKFQERMEQARPYSKNLSEMIEHLLSDVVYLHSHYFFNRSVKEKPTLLLR